MTDDEIVALVQDFWVDNMGTSIEPVGYWLTKMKDTYDNALALMYSTTEEDSIVVIEAALIEILTYIWACALQYDSNIDWDVDAGASRETQTPKAVDFDELCLDVTDMSWTTHKLYDFLMMLSTFIRQASDAWEDDVTTWYTNGTSNNIRKAAQTIRQYFINWS